jgi:CoA:oxalate CoA-transferase
MTSANRDETRPMPLAGIRVIDFGQIYQGPYATFLMAMAGAEIIKVEPPYGEQARNRSRTNKGSSLPFEMLNSNKLSVTLNLKTEEGKELLRKMVREADVLLENFAPGVMDRLGVGWSVLREVNPRLIYASASGYGLTGPDRDNLAMDLTIQATSGVMACTGFEDSPPVKAGPAVADFMGGMSLYAGVVTALLERASTGVGRLVEIAMIETMYPTLSSSLGLMYSEGGHALRVGNRHSGLSLAPYNVYPVTDGHIAILCPQEHHWDNLLVAMGRTDLKGDGRFATNAARVARMNEVDELVESWSAKLPRQEVLAALKEHKVPAAPVREVHEVVECRHLHERGMLERINHPRLGSVVAFHSPLRLHDAERTPLVPAPDLGANNDDVYGRMLGVSAKTLAQYREAGVI